MNLRDLLTIGTALCIAAALFLLLSGCATTSISCTVTVPAQSEWHTWRVKHNGEHCFVFWVPPECGKECSEEDE